MNRRKYIRQSALTGAALSLSSFLSKVFSRERSALSDTPTTVSNQLVLWYDKPATQWVEALPIGNGRLGAMVFGGTENERLQLNEDTLYGGGPYDPNNLEALKALPEARRLIFEESVAERQFCEKNILFLFYFQ